MSSQTFTLFPDLPPEISRKIWSIAAQHPRIVKFSLARMQPQLTEVAILGYQSALSTIASSPGLASSHQLLMPCLCHCLPTMNWCKVTSTAPAVLSACFQSREIALQFYARQSNVMFSKPFWFNTEHDTVWFEGPMARYLCRCRIQQDKYFAGIQHIVIAAPWSVDVDLDTYSYAGLPRKERKFCLGIKELCNQGLKKISFLPSNGVLGEHSLSAQMVFDKVAENYRQSLRNHKQECHAITEEELQVVEYVSQDKMEKWLNAA